MRVKVLALRATAFAVGVCALQAATSAAPAAAEQASSPVVAEPLVASECAAGNICFWTGKTYGRAECRSGENCFSWFAGSDLGYHALANIDPQSMYNHTGSRVAVFEGGLFGEGTFFVLPGEKLQFGGRWTKGFEIVNCGAPINC